VQLTSSFQLYIDSGTADDSSFGHPFAGYFLPYPGSSYNGLVTTISEISSTLNWIYVDRTTFEVKYGARTQAEPNLTEPFDCLEAGHRVTLQGCQRFFAFEEEPYLWALYYGLNWEGLKRKRDSGSGILPVHLTRRPITWRIPSQTFANIPLAIPQMLDNASWPGPARSPYTPSITEVAVSSPEIFWLDRDQGEPEPFQIFEENMAGLRHKCKGAPQIVHPTIRHVVDFDEPDMSDPPAFTPPTLDEQMSSLASPTTLFSIPEESTQSSNSSFLCPSGGTSNTSHEAVYNLPHRFNLVQLHNNSTTWYIHSLASRSQVWISRESLESLAAFSRKPFSLHNLVRRLRSILHIHGVMAKAKCIKIHMKHSALQKSLKDEDLRE